MKELSVLIKPSSSLCNLRCRYCFYADVSENREVASTGIMQDDMMDILTQRIHEELPEGGTANISFQGGEPTVAGVDWFRKFAASMDRFDNIQVNWSMQTNATLLTEEFCQFLHDRKFLLGVSLDGYQTNHDHFRYDAKGKGAFLRVLKGIRLLKKAGVDYNILTVVTHDLAAHASALYSFYKQQHFEYIQLIPCLPALGSTDDPLALKPEDFERFYKEFFNCWFEDALKGNAMSINLFENLAGMINGYPPYQCGLIGRCIVQYVIESDGSVYPCDFFCLDELKLGDLRECSFEQLRSSDRAKRFIAGSACRKSPCKDCPHVNLCSGGCRRQNVCYLSDDHCGYRSFLDEALPKLAYLTRQYRNR